MVLMDRRDCLKAIALAGAPGLGQARATGRPIELHVDLEVDPPREEEMLANFHTKFEPVIRRQPGFVAVRMLKLRSKLTEKGIAPRYRLVISFETEEQRLGWVASAEHQRVWPEIEKTLTGEKYSAVLFDEV